MNIVKFKKIGLDKYKIYLDDTELILYEDVILKYNLLIKHNIDLKELETIIEENKYYEVYNIALKYISIKLRSKDEVISYLSKKEFSNKLIEEVIKHLEEEGYLNEKVFIEAYINDEINLKSDGPYKIKSNLLNLGINENLIDEHIDKIDNDVWKAKIKKHIEKAVNLNKKYSSTILKQKILYDLYLKGFDNDMISLVLENININNGDCSNLETEYNKAYKKFSSKYKGKELVNKIYVYLQRKGFNYYDIKKEFEN